jgi:hypothetical protein
MLLLPHKWNASSKRSIEVAGKSQLTDRGEIGKSDRDRQRRAGGASSRARNAALVRERMPDPPHLMRHFQATETVAAACQALPQCLQSLSK